MKSVLMVLAGLACICALTACNTMKGVGQDLSVGGKAITKSADKHGAQ